MGVKWFLHQNSLWFSFQEKGGILKNLPLVNSFVRWVQPAVEYSSLLVPAHAIHREFFTTESALGSVVDSRLRDRQVQASYDRINRHFGPYYPQASSQSHSRQPKKDPDNLHRLPPPSGNQRIGFNSKEGLGPDDLDPIEYLNALFRELMKHFDDDTVILFSRTGEFGFFELAGLASEISPLEFFLKYILDIDEDEMPEVMGDDLMDQYQDELPVTVAGLMEHIHEYIEKIGHDVVMSAGDGRIFAMNILDNPEGADPLHTLVDRINPNARSDSEKIDEDEEAEPVHRQIKAVEPKPDESELDTIIKPFSEIILPSLVLNRALRSVGLRTLIRHRDEKLLDLIHSGEVKFPNGSIYAGPAGTGKSMLMGAIGHAYAQMGCHVQEVKLGAMEDKYAGSLARNLTKVFDKALEEAKKTGKPSLVIIDEASNIASAVSQGESLSKYYQGALDVIKNYTVNHPELVLIMATNIHPDYIDPTLVRSGRLSLVTFSHPDNETKMRLFNQYLKKHDVFKEDLTELQKRKLLEFFPEATAANIAEFCESFYDRLMSAEQVKNGLKTELDLIRYEYQTGTVLSGDDLKKGVTFELVLAQLDLYVKEIRAHRKTKKTMGF